MGIFHNLGSPVPCHDWLRSETVSCSAGEGYRNTELEEQGGKSELRCSGNRMKAVVGAACHDSSCTGKADGQELCT